MTASNTQNRPARPGFGFARRNGATLVGWDGPVARVAYREGIRPQVLAELRRYLGAEMQLQSMAAEDFDALLQRIYEHGDEDANQMAADIGDELDLHQVAEALPEPEDLLESEDDAPIIRLINALLTQAVKENASDIHIEPLEHRLMVRYRVDGVLREVLSPKRSMASLVVSRIKVMAQLDIAEKRVPQDGRISLRVAGRPVDVRVSTIPAGHGERVVLRLLDKQAGRLDLKQLGMPTSIESRMEDLIHRPHGILLVTGPTGSGKTTTLYAALSRLNDRSRNIMTVEDPIEYHIDGIGQTQVNNKVEMDFARGLRAILRQDPDVVMVGEIRDLETARIAVQASLTGHLVLSTLHTNSAVGAVTRLRDMGVEPFLLSSSLIGVLAQRLVRVLDPDQREAYPASPAECAAFGQDHNASLTLFRPRSGTTERHVGYRGRSGIYDLITVDQRLRDLIHEGASEQEMQKHVRRSTPGILADGWEKVIGGLTSVEEVLRVTRQEIVAAYEYQALDSRGHQTRGVTQGDTARQVRQALRDKGLNPLSVEAISESMVSRSTLGLGSGFGNAELSLVLRQLASLTTAGLPLEEVLATVTDQAEKPAVKKIMASIRARVMEGHSMSAGMTEYPRAFPHLVCATVAAGEQSGQLDQVLLRLADYAETREELGRKVGLALLYPVLLTLIALAVVIGLMAYVVPKVTQVFENMQQSLPPLTRALIATSDFIVAYGVWLGAATALLVLIGLLLLRVEQTRYAWHGLLLRLPVVGRLMRGVQTARFSRTLGILTASAVPLLQGLKIAAEVVTNLPMRRSVSKIGAQVREGSSLNQALARSKQFPPLVVRLVASGEKSGQLDEMLERAADNQEREVETTTAVLMGILEPALILLVGLMVMTIVLAIMLPILQMNQLVR